MLRLCDAAAVVSLEDLVRLGVHGCDQDIITHIAASRAKSTTGAYIGYFDAYRRFVLKANGTVFPVKTPVLLRFLQQVFASGVGVGAVRTRVTAVSFCSNLAGYGPVSDTFITAYIDGLKRSGLGAPAGCRQKLHLEKNHMVELFQKFSGVACTFKDHRDLMMVCLCFYSFLRASEMLALKLKDVQVCSDHLKVHVGRSKTDQFGTGADVFIARNENSEVCPVKLMETYISQRQTYLSGRGVDGDDPSGILFFNLSGVAGACKKVCTYNAFRIVFRRMVSILGLNPNDYGTHSLRAGGTTMAIRQGLPREDVQRHGRWRLASSMDGYIRSRVVLPT